MRRIDPLRWLFLFYSLVNQAVRLLFSPLQWIHSSFLYLRRIFNRHLRLDSIGDAGPIRSARHGFYWLASRPLSWKKSDVALRAQKAYPIRAVRRMVGLTFRVSLLEPAKWLIQLAGFSYLWTKTRPWRTILLSGSPLLFLFAMVFLDWRGSRIDKKILAQSYLERGEAELGRIEQSFDYWAMVESDSGAGERGVESYSRDHRTGFERGQAGLKSVSGYGELLFRRIHAINRSDESYFVVALRMLQLGNSQESRRILLKIAPDDDVKDIRGHAVMAAILLHQIGRTADESLLPIFQHHATAGARWYYIPAEVLAASSELYWNSGDRNKALSLLDYASEIRPEFFLLYYERAVEAGLTPLADAIRVRGITRYRRLLDLHPKDDFLRSQLATLESTEKGGLERAEKLLSEGISNDRHPVLSRTLSEVYLKLFRQNARTGVSRRERIGILDKAMVTDVSNPNIPDAILEFLAEEEKNHAQEELISELNATLATGKANTGTHAILAEYFLQKDHKTPAIIHLEQVHKVAPMAAKYSYYLANEYVLAGRLQDAYQVANRAMLLISEKNLLTERYVDDLLDTLGEIYQKQEVWEEAIPVYELCLSLNPERAKTRLRLAAIYRIMDNEEGAREQESFARSAEEMVQKRSSLVRKLSSPESLLRLSPNTEVDLGGEIQDDTFPTVATTEESNPSRGTE